MKTDIEKDRVQNAIVCFGKPLLLGKIDNWEDIFEELSYFKAQDPHYGKTFFPLVSKVNGTQWFDLKRDITLHAKPSQLLLDAIRIAHGHRHLKQETGYFYPVREETNWDNITGFKLIEWDKQGVVLVQTSRLDHSDFGTYIGFIDVSKVPKVLPGEPEKIQSSRPAMQPPMM